MFVLRLVFLSATLWRYFASLRWHPLYVFGSLALPLCGAAVTFFAAAKKVTKESRF
jgi:hypothetical protein